MTIRPPTLSQRQTLHSVASAHERRLDRHKNYGATCVRGEYLNTPYTKKVITQCVRQSAFGICLASRNNGTNTNNPQCLDKRSRKCMDSPSSVSFRARASKRGRLCNNDLKRSQNTPLAELMSVKRCRGYKKQHICAPASLSQTRISVKSH